MDFVNFCFFVGGMAFALVVVAMSINDLRREVKCLRGDISSTERALIRMVRRGCVRPDGQSEC